MKSQNQIEWYVNYDERCNQKAILSEMKDKVSNKEIISMSSYSKKKIIIILTALLNLSLEKFPLNVVHFITLWNSTLLLNATVFTLFCILHYSATPYKTHIKVAH